MNEESLLQLIGSSAGSVALAVLPLSAIFLVFQFLFLKLPTQSTIDNREENNAGLALDLAQDTLELARCSYQGVDMLERLEICIVGRCCSCHRIQSFTRRI